MLTLALNPGSTNTKYTLFQGSKQIGATETGNNPDALSDALKTLGPSEKIADFGIRIVHGGELFSEPTLVTFWTMRKLRKLAPLDPLHLPYALDLILQIRKYNPRAQIVAVFDTSFHATIPPIASTYPLSPALRKKLGIRKYGFHGLAYQSVVSQLRKKYKRLPPRIIACHLGGGCSLCALKNGVSVDTSMGFTPLSGVMMPTRSGDIDPGIFAYLKRVKNYTPEHIDQLLNHQAGLFALTGTSEMERIIERAKAKDPLCLLAVNVFCYRIAQYIGAYRVTLGGAENILVFSGGIGQHSAYIREKITKLIGAKSKVLTISVDENREILQATKKLLKK